jgi:hypothetical protein
MPILRGYLEFLPFTFILVFQRTLKRIGIKRIYQLSSKSFRKFGFRQACAFGPFIFWQIKSAKNLINEREKHRKIFTIIFFFDTMMPVVILRGCKNIPQPADMHAGIRMYKNGMNGNDKYVGIEHNWRKTTDIQKI